jgi:hypothetical protein
MWRFTVVLITAFHWSLCQKIQIQPALPSRILMSSHLWTTALKWTSTFRCSEQNHASISDHRHAWHKIFSDFITVVLFGTFFRIFSSIFLSKPLLNVFSLCNSSWARTQVSARSTRSLNINICSADCRPNDRIFWTELWQALLELTFRNRASYI